MGGNFGHQAVACMGPWPDTLAFLALAGDTRISQYTLHPGSDSDLYRSVKREHNDAQHRLPLHRKIDAKSQAPATGRANQLWLKRSGTMCGGDVLCFVSVRRLEEV